MSSTSDGPSVEEVYHDAALQFLNVQISTNGLLDARTYQVFMIGSTVLPLTFALLNLSTREVTDQANWFLGGALGFYVIVLVCALRVSFVRELNYRPDISVLAEYTETFKGQPLAGQTMKEWGAREYLTSIKLNQQLLVVKGRWIGGLTTMLFIECLSLALAAILTLVI